MKKLRLDPEALAVETFDTTPPEPATRGTVHGHDTKWCHTPDTFCASPSVECSLDTCDHTCGCMTGEDCIDWTN
jgi:hypothetical protein